MSLTSKILFVAGVAASAAVLAVVNTSLEVKKAVETAWRQSYF